MRFGNLGYIEFYYTMPGAVQAAVIYLRADDKFVALKSTNDFSKRLEWDKSKFEAVKKWLEDHAPKVTDLGVVVVSASQLTRVDLGGGTACQIRVFPKPAVGTNSSFYSLLLTKEVPVEQPGQFYLSKRFDRLGQPWVFSMDGKFYRMTPALDEMLKEPIPLR